MGSRKKPYREGCWIAVPLAKRGGYGFGVIARCKSGICLGYFFAPRHSRVPSIADAEGLKPEQAVLIEMFGDMGLIKDGWPIVGYLSDWKREEWPIPVFSRESHGAYFLVHYDDDDPTGRYLREERTSGQEANKYFADGLSGHMALSIGLDRALHEHEHGVTRLKALSKAPSVNTIKTAH